ncbi:DUF1054 domain-containing protein [Aciduricibacillus chroicocephali]|uniref:UPF0637 protein QR721_05375 n=1 Tax=Aciduricibacillus chroicocephali TaxID=3054939 RepID=A0ABY9KZ25_9BACI|nr:DUF1054 domain-containing protein [Bacillaceae bacterium 44XB]
MDFNGFHKTDFDTFLIDGLEERMEAIQTRIQPKFREIGSELEDHLSAQLGNEMFLHIAKHARRTVNPPKDTWLAVADNKRGYKKHPHFQVGLFDDHVFIWLALIYELDFKSEIASKFLEHYDELKALPDHYAVSLDHMKNSSFTVAELEQKDLERFRDVKKAEFLVGLHLKPGDPILEDGEKFMNITKKTIDSLIPFYKLALSARHA